MNKDISKNDMLVEFIKSVNSCNADEAHAWEVGFNNGRDYNEEHNPTQIDPWKAIEYSLEHLDDYEDKHNFLLSCMESDMTSIRVDDAGDESGGWPDFVEWVATQ